MKNLYILRVDVHENIGYGHYSRCFILANFIKKIEKTSKIMIIGRGLVNKHESKIEHLDMKHNPEWNIKKNNTRSWLGDIVDNDSSYFLDLLVTHVDNYNYYRKYLIIDHYGIDIDWEDKMKSYFTHIIVIDDLADRLHDCDLLIDQTAYPKGFNPYHLITTKKTKILLGVKYFIFNNDNYIDPYSYLRTYDDINQDNQKSYKDYIKNYIKKLSNDYNITILRDNTKITKNELNILISFGGSDPKNYTYIVYAFLVKYFNKLSTRENLREGLNIHKTSKYFTEPHMINFIFVFGPLVDKNIYEKTKDKILNLNCYNMKFTFEFYHDISNLQILQLINKSNLAFGATGVSSYERCLSGLPSIGLIIANNQHKNANYFNHMGYLRLIRNEGKDIEIELENNMDDLFKNDFSKLKKISEKCLTSFDTHGCQRIYDEISQLL